MLGFEKKRSLFSLFLCDIKDVGKMTTVAEKLFKGAYKVTNSRV